MIYDSGWESPIQGYEGSLDLNIRVYIYWTADLKIQGQALFLM